LEWTIAWYRAAQQGADMRQKTLAQIAAYQDIAASAVSNLPATERGNIP
jgi:hypothetical protein